MNYTHAVAYVSSRLKLAPTVADECMAIWSFGDGKVIDVDEAPLIIYSDGHADASVNGWPDDDLPLLAMAGWLHGNGYKVEVDVDYHGA